METISVSGRREFIDEVTDPDRDLPISKEGADELWRVWEYRYKNGADEYLVFMPKWMAQQDFGKQWPYMFAQVELDKEDKGAILFRDCRIIDPSIMENQVWSKVNMSDVVEKLDISETSDFVDDPGKTWVARTKGAVFEMVEDEE